MKAVLAIGRGEIPPTVGITNFNPNIDFNGACVKVVTDLTPWPSGAPRRVSINSFGYGGANAHVILDHAQEVLSGYCKLPDKIPFRTNGVPKSYNINARAPCSGVIAEEECSTNEPAHSSESRRFLLPFSAHDAESLKANIRNLSNLRHDHDLKSLSYTLAARRTLYPSRAFVMLSSDLPPTGLNLSDCVFAKHSASREPTLCFVFTGQGAQWVGMGSELYEKYSAFTSSIDDQDAILARLSNGPNWRIAGVLQDMENVSIHHPEISQTVCTALQVALVDLLASWNITPVAVVGHSSGEIAATYAAGRISVVEAILAAYFRGYAASKLEKRGKMVAVGLGVEQLTRYLEGKESRARIAAINSSVAVTLSGESDAIDDLSRQFEEEAIFCRQLQTGGMAYHSHHMAEVGLLYERLLDNGLAELKHLIQNKVAAESPLVWSSSVWPHKRSSKITINSKYWRRNLESPVRFSEAVENLLQHDVSTFLEIGPHPALRSTLKQSFKSPNPSAKDELAILATLSRHRDSVTSLLELSGYLFLHGYPVDISQANQTTKVTQTCQDLPNYAYHYGEILYHESRMSKEWRLRKHLRHDLLGARRTGDSGLHPSWRNVIVLNHVPWLRDHKVSQWHRHWECG